MPPSKSIRAGVRGGSCYLDATRQAHCAPAGAHIVFMGDSVTRYQWLALATSFRRGSELDPAEFPSSANEQEWPNWKLFFNGTNNRLEPHGRCDCFRSDARPLGSKIVENRYFWLPGRLNLTYIQVLGQARNKADNWNKAVKLPIVGSWAPTPPLDDERNRAGLREEFAPAWQLNWTETIERVVGALRPPPTVLILNCGLWGSPDKEDLTELRAAAKRAAPRVLWKTTTTQSSSAGSTKWVPNDKAARRTFDEVFDAANLTSAVPRELYWNNNHFRAPVYNHLNAALLRQLYGSTGR